MVHRLGGLWQALEWLLRWMRIHVTYSCYIAFPNCTCVHTHTHTSWNCHSDAPNIQYLEEMEWLYGSMHPTGWWRRGGSRKLSGLQLDFCLPPRADIKSFIFEAAACLVVFFFSVAVQQTKPSRVTAQNCSMQNWLVCPIAWFIGCQSRSVFLFSVFAVCARTTDWNKGSVGCSLLHKGYDWP